MMKKTIATIALAACALFPAMAQRTVTVYHEDGAEPVTCPLAEDLKFTFDSSAKSITLAKGGSTLVSVPLSKVKKIVFEGKTSVGRIEASAGLSASTDASGNTLRLIGELPAACPLTVYGADGMRRIFVAGFDGQDIDISSLSAGMYILRVGDFTTKFFKK